jgi:hypothetical protein
MRQLEFQQHHELEFRERQQFRHFFNFVICGGAQYFGNVFHQ